jgi:hypothetical protein
MNPEQQRIEIAKACGEGHHHLRNLPDYLNDLNAMHEAEKVLDSTQGDRYFELLDQLDVPSISATAAQRAEAFLRTIGKWTTNQNVI